MNLLGVIVKHEKYGEGIVKRHEGNHLFIEFQQGDKMFQFPDAFNGYLSATNKNIASAIDLEIQKKKQSEIEKQRILVNVIAQPKMQQNIKFDNISMPTEGYGSSWGAMTDEYFSNREILLRIKKENESAIKKIIEQRKIEYLVHFTRMDNLQSILQNGLIPVSMHQNMKIVSIHNDEQRIDSKLDCTSCSVGFPNYKLFYSFALKFPGTQWVVLLINKDVLFSNSNIAYYCHTNAAGVFPGTLSAKELCKADAFENMFSDSYTTRDNKMIQRGLLQINDYMTTDPQAEILISDIIDRKYISRIYFQNQRDIDDFKFNNRSDVLKQYDYRVVPEFFDARKDYVFWKKEC